MSKESVEETDVLIAGAGPAGSLAAHQLARQGLRVLLADKAKFPRTKVCGSTLHPCGIEVLEACGLGRLLPEAMARGHAVPLLEARVFTAGRLIEIDLRGSLAVGRDTFDLALAKAAVEEGAELRDETTASLEDGPPAGGRRRVRLRGPGGERIVGARVVVAADGLGGSLRRSTAARPQAGAQRVGVAWTTADAPEAYSTGRLFMASSRGGYVGLVRLGCGRLVVACALDPQAVRAAGGAGSLAAAILDEAELPGVPGMQTASWHGTSGFPAASSVLARDRFFAIGDAASFVEPFTGQGISWALASARAVAPIVASAVREWRDDLVQAWTRTHARVVGRRQLECRALAWVLRRPQATHAVAAVLSSAPRLAAPLVRRLTR